jgi:hypothetical protein
MNFKQQDAESAFGEPVNRPAVSTRRTAIQLRRQMCQPIGHKKLTSCLKLLGLWPIPAWSRGFNEQRQTFRRGRNSPTMKQLSQKDLYDLHDLARKQWLVLYEKFQVQTGRNHGVGVWLNAFWVHVRKLFRRMGVEPGRG